MNVALHARRLDAPPFSAEFAIEVVLYCGVSYGGCDDVMSVAASQVVAAQGVEVQDVVDANWSNGADETMRQLQHGVLGATSKTISTTQA